MRYFLIFFTLVLFANCSSVHKEYLINDNTCHYNDPIFKISKEELIIDDSSYKNEYWYSKDETTNEQTR